MILAALGVLLILVSGCGKDVTPQYAYVAHDGTVCYKMSIPCYCGATLYDCRNGRTYRCERNVRQIVYNDFQD